VAPRGIFRFAQARLGHDNAEQQPAAAQDQGEAKMEHSVLAERAEPAVPVHREVIDLPSLAIHHLRTPAEIARILHLRENIDLSIHARAGGEFERLEKKETSAASSARSKCTASRSARSASCRWGWA
jgi:hypothetical protein